MTRRIAVTLGFIVIIAANSMAQPVYVGPGSTLHGDYLRGAGVAAYGMEMGNLLADRWATDPNLIRG